MQTKLEKKPKHNSEKFSSLQQLCSLHPSFNSVSNFVIAFVNSVIVVSYSIAVLRNE